MAALGDSVFQNLEQVDEKTLKFTMTPVVVTYANTLRRAVQTEVEVLGFRADMLEDGSTADVKILKNTTPMSNEMLADRVGLLPIQMPAGSGWEKESVLFRLRVKNDTDSVRLITASGGGRREKDDSQHAILPPESAYRRDVYYCGVEADGGGPGARGNSSRGVCEHGQGA